MVRSPLAASLATVLVLWASPALALDFGSSATTGKSVFAIPLRFATPASMPVGVEFGLRYLPSLSDALGPARINPNLAETFSMLGDADLDLDVNVPVANIPAGPFERIRPILTPYLGYRYLGAVTNEFTDPRTSLASGNPSAASQAGTALSYSQFGGINYGVKAAVGLPLGFEAHAGVGLTTLISGGWDTRKYDASSLAGGKSPSLNVTGAGKIDVGGATLPGFNLGASWTAPLNALQLSIGYETYVLPTLLRAQTGKLDGARSVINNLSVGVRILSFAF